MIEAAENTTKEYGVKIERMDIRDLDIHPCKGCYRCAKDGVCVQKDDMAAVLKALHSCDGLIVEVPIYYNCMAAQALLVIDRLCCTFAYKTISLGQRKKLVYFSPAPAQMRKK